MYLVASVDLSLRPFVCLCLSSPVKGGHYWSESFACVSVIRGICRCCQLAFDLKLILDIKDTTSGPHQFYLHC